MIGLPALAMSLVGILAAAGTAGCNGCEAKCVGPAVEISISPEVASVTICDADGICTKQGFGPVEGKTIGRTFTVPAVDHDGRIPVRVQAVTTAGAQVGPITLKPKPTSGSCGCSGPAHVWVDANGAGLYDDK
ncbi:MAG TPA: hypothetical protein PKV27_11710 [Ilumatobacteraceae bacterium]|nr:hypothetical protein [Ilumatobacteraceae bacterium]